MVNGQFKTELENLSRSKSLFSGSRDEMLMEFGSRLTTCLHVERVNVWLFDDKDDSIVCIGHYEHSLGGFSKGQRLRMQDMPHYFQLLRSNEVICVSDVFSAPETAELAESYCRPNRIVSMMDVPVRMEGKLVGVVCYEHTGAPRIWTDDEVSFTTAVSQLVALLVETAQRRKIQAKLEQALKDKDLLLREMHHRIKNNLSVLVSLLRLHESEIEDKRALHLLKETENRLFTIAEIHEQLYKDGRYVVVELKEYLSKLSDDILQGQTSEAHRPQIISRMEMVEVPTSVAVNLGLIVTEVLNNMLKHAFPKAGSDNLIGLTLTHQHNLLTLTLTDNGRGFDADNMPKASVGLEIVKDLAEQIRAQTTMTSSPDGTRFELILRTTA